MADNNKTEEVVEEVVEDTTKTATKTVEEQDQDLVKKLVADRLDAELAPIKGKLDNAFKQRDEALAKIAEFERKEKEATLLRLKEEGKHLEAYELQIAEAKAENEALRRQNTELSRDVQVRDCLKGYQFKNGKAHDMAFKEIVGALVQNEQKQWVHRTGISIQDFCEAFSKDDEQSFLFKAKTNSGAGTTTSTGNPAGDQNGKKKSLLDIPVSEMLKLQAEGKLPKPGKR